MMMKSNDNNVRRYLGIKLTSARAGIIIATKRGGGVIIWHMLGHITTWDICSNAVCQGSFLAFINVLFLLVCISREGK